MVEAAFKKLCDVDGRSGRTVLPFPHDLHFNPEIKRWEAISVAQRLRQIDDRISSEEASTLKSFISAISGNDMDSTGFFDILRWWALCGYTVGGLYDCTETYKIPTGQSSFAKCFFDEAVRTENLSYCFNTRVTSIVQDRHSVTLNNSWSAKRVICTLPLNVLPHVSFQPPLSTSKAVAARIGNINIGAKVHLEVQGRNLRSWTGISWPASRIFSCLGDGLTPAGNAHIVCFGTNQIFEPPEVDAQDFVAAAKEMHESMDVRKTVSPIIALPTCVLRF